jgi:lipopolysaccharide export system protein LptA
MWWNSALAGLLLLLPGILFALPEDRKAPVEIESDQADVDQAHERTIFTGHVHVTQGTFTLWSDKLVVQYRNKTPYEITATGNPARFRELPEKGKSWVNGSAQRIVYRFDADDVLLSGNAELQQNDDTFRSDRMIYDRKSARLKAGAAAGGKQRVRVILHPKEEKPQ